MKNKRKVFGLLDSFKSSMVSDYAVDMSLFTRKHDLVACEQQRRRSACAFAQADQRLCCLLSGKDDSRACYMQRFENLAGLYS